MGERTATQAAFINGQTQIIVATSAFGMGVDKGDIAFVINYNMPQSLEEYYQEAGRAGRNGADAHCTLFYSSEDLRIGKALACQQEKPDQALRLLATMWDYCQFDGCLRNYILRYFGETRRKNCGKCSYCCPSAWWKQLKVFFRNERNY